MCRLCLQHNTTSLWDSTALQHLSCKVVSLINHVSCSLAIFLIVLSICWACFNTSFVSPNFFVSYELFFSNSLNISLSCLTCVCELPVCAATVKFIASNYWIGIKVVSTISRHRALSTKTSFAVKNILGSMVFFSTANLFIKYFNFLIEPLQFFCWRFSLAVNATGATFKMFTLS